MSSPDSIQPFVPPQEIQTTTPVVEGEVVEIPEDEAQDTIESSQELIASLYYLLLNLIAGQPQLTPPMMQEGEKSLSIEESVRKVLNQFGISGKTSNDELTETMRFLLQANQQLNQVGIDIVTKWGESIKKIDREIQEWISSLTYRAQIEQKSPAYQEKREELTFSIQNVFTHTNQRLDMIHQTEPEVLTTIPALAAAILISVPIQAVTAPLAIQTAAPITSEVNVGLVDMARGTVHETSTVAETTMAQAANQLNPELRPDILGQLGALVAAPLFQTVWTEAVGSTAKTSQADLYAQAQTFAREVLKLVTKENALETFLAPYLKNLPVERPKGSDVITQKDFIALNKLILGMIALGLLLKAQRGAKKFNEADFASMSDLIRKGVQIPEDADLYQALAEEPDELTRSLIILIVNQLRILEGHPQLPGLIERLLQYLQEGPDAEKMFRPTQVLRDILKSDVHNYKREPKG